MSFSINPFVVAPLKFPRRAEDVCQDGQVSLSAGIKVLVAVNCAAILLRVRC